MTAYLALVSPPALRTFGDATPALVNAELEAFGATASGSLEEIGGALYAPFELREPDRLAELGNLSFAMAVFERAGELLRPLAAGRSDRYDESLVGGQHYAGKTSEVLTRLAVNLALLELRGTTLGDPITVLDPVCGRGTSLNQALLY